MEFIIIVVSVVLAALIAVAVAAIREVQLVTAEFHGVCDELLLADEREREADAIIADYSEMIDSLISERECLQADNEGLREHVARHHREAEEMAALMTVQGCAEFSGERQAMSHRLYGRQSDVTARRGRRDRERFYR